MLLFWMGRAQSPHKNTEVKLGYIEEQQSSAEHLLILDNVLTSNKHHLISLFTSPGVVDVIIFRGLDHT